MGLFQVHRKNTSTLIDRLILPFGFVILVLGSISSVQAEPICYGEVDLVFIIDASFSISLTDLQNVIRFCADVYDAIFEDGGRGDNIHAGAFFYASYIYQGEFFINLGGPTNGIRAMLSKRFVKAPDNINTNTAEALDTMLKMFNDSGRQGSTKVALLITDGESDDTQRTRSVADKIKETEILMFAVGIGKDVKMNELRNIATNGDFAILQEDLSEEGFLGELLRKICAETLDNRDDVPVDRESLAMNVVFLLPEAVMDADFQISKDFVKNIMRRFAISESYARVGIIKYGEGVVDNLMHYVRLDQYNTERDFFAALDDLSRNYANEDANSVHEGLRVIRDWSNELDGSTTPLIVVLLMPGLSSNVELAISQAELLNGRENPKAYLLVLGIGTETDAWRSERNNLAYNDETLFYTSNFIGISGNDATSQRLIDDVANVIRRIGRGTFEVTVPVDTSRWRSDFDIIFMLDGSQQVSSFGKQQVMKVLIIQIIEDFVLYSAERANGGRVGVMLYDGSGMYNEIRLGDYQSREDLIAKIQGLQFIQQTEYADNARALAFLRGSMAAYGREGVAKIGFMVTFSPSPFPLLATAEAREVGREGIQLMLVGLLNLGQREFPSLQQELESLQMFDPEDSDVVISPFISVIQNYQNQLSTDLQNYASIVRPTGIPFAWEDVFDLIVMVHDESGRNNDGDATKFLLRDLFSRHFIRSDGVRVGLITFGAGVNTGPTRQLVLGNTPFIGTLLAYVFYTLDLTPTNGANIEAAFDAAMDMFNNNGRVGVPKVAVLITDDISISDSLDAKIEQANNQGITLMAVGIDDADTARLQRFASDARLAFNQPDWDSIQVTTEMNAGIIAAVRGQIPPISDGIRRLEDQCAPKAAIIFLIDASGSMSTIFEDVKAFVAALMSGFKLPTVQIGSIAFSEDVIGPSKIDPGEVMTYVDLNLLFNQRLGNTGGLFTRTHLGLDEVIQMFEMVEDSYRKIGVLVTDGRSSNPDLTVEKGDEARSAGISLVAIGVGTQPDGEELLNLTKSEDLYIEFSNLDFKDFTRLKELQETICYAANQPPPIVVVECSMNMELVILMDLSSNIVPLNRIFMRGILLQFIESFPFISDTTVRVGVVGYGSQIFVDEVLSLSGDKAAIAAAIEAAVVYSNFDTGSGTITAGAMDYARALLRESRTDVAQVVLVFTDGIYNQGDMPRKADELRDGKIYSVAVSFTFPQPYLEALEIIGTFGLDSVALLANNPPPSTIIVDSVNQIRGKVCLENFECRYKLHAIFILDIEENSAISDKATKFTDDLTTRFLSSETRVVTVGPSGFGSLEEAFFNASQEVKVGAPSDTVLNIICITDKEFPAGTSLVSRTINIRQDGIKITVINAGASPDSSWADVASGSLNVYPEYYLDTLRLAWFICKVPCESGSEIKENGKCGACDKGFYRDKTTDYHCVPCSGSDTTPGTGSTSALQCIISVCEIPMDLMFIIDATGSIGTDFDELKGTFLRLINKFPVGLAGNQTRIGYVTIGDTVDSDSYRLLRDSINPFILIFSIASIPGGELVTNTAASIEKMSEIFREDGRDGVPKIALVITDGGSVNSFETKRQSALAHLQGISMISIGVGEFINEEEIDALASKPSYALNFQSFQDLINVETFHVDVCNAARDYVFPDTTDPQPPLTGDCLTRTDIVFVLDASTGVDPGEFNNMKSFIQNIIFSFDIGQDKIRAGAIAYSNAVHQEVFSLDSAIDFDSVQFAIAIQTQQGSAVRNTALAMDRAIKMFNADSTVRDNIARVIVLITSGQASDAAGLTDRGLQAQNAGIRVIGIGVGAESEAVIQELETVASDELFTVVPSINDLDIEYTIDLVCAADFQCEEPMEITVIWNLNDFENIKNVEQFTRTMTQEFSDSLISSIFIDHVPNVAVGLKEGIDEMLQSTNTDRTRAFLLFIDGNITSSNALLQLEADRARDAGILVAVVDAFQNSNDLDNVTSYRKLSFQTNKFNELPYSVLIKENLCRAPCASGSSGNILPSGLVCEECPKDSYRDAADSFTCTPCPNNQLTDGPGSTSVDDCKTGKCATPMDIIYVIDASESISLLEFNGLLKFFLTNTLSEYDIGIHRVGLVPYSTDVFLNQVFDLADSRDINTLLDAVGNLTQDRRGSGTNTAKAIDTTRDIFRRQGRPDVMQTMVVITDGISNNRYRTSEAARIAKEAFIRIISIGVGEVFLPEIREIASEDSYYTINSYGELAFTQNFIRNTCEDTYFCLKEMNIVIFEDITSADSQFLARLDRFRSTLTSSYASTIESVQVTQQTLEDTVINVAFPKLSTEPGKTKTFLFIMRTDIEAESTKTIIQSLREQGGVVALIKANPTLTNRNFVDLVSKSTLLIEMEFFDEFPYVRHVERDLCTGPCGDGFERALDGFCAACGLGFRRQAVESLKCVQCPDGLTTREVGGVTLSQCIPDCGPGTYTVGGVCRDCEVGTYQPIKFVTECISCPPGQTTLANRSQSLDDCIANCGPGTRRSVDNDECIECPEDFYQPEPLQTSCLPCPINLGTDSTGSDSLEDCKGACSLKMDIIILVDASTSISISNFQLMKAFLISTINRFIVNEDETRFGIIAFARDVIPSPQLSLNQSTSRTVAINVARILLKGTQSGTNMVAALTAARQMFTDQGVTGRIRRVLLLTDGIASNSISTIEEARKLKSELFVHITCIGIGTAASLPLLRDIATNPGAVISESSFVSLATRNILPDLCGETCPIPMDVFVVSHYVNNFENNRKVSDFFTAMISKFVNSNIIPFDNAIGDLNLALNQIQDDGDPFFTKSVVIITDQPFPSDLAEPVNLLKNNSFVVSVINAASGIPDGSFDGFVSDPNLVFNILDFHISPYSEYILRTLCISQCEIGSERNTAGRCTLCDIGSFRDTNARSCVPCPPQQTTNDAGSTAIDECIDCEPGRWLCSDDVQCIALNEQCDGDTNCDDGSDEVCINCGPGNYWNGSTCIQCGVGTYQNIGNQTSCVPCPTGSTTPMIGSDSEDDCSITCDEDGYQLGSNGICEPCLTGSYRNAQQDLTCIPCPNGYTTFIDLASSIQDCYPNCTEGEVFVNDQCEDCPENTFQPEKYQTTCLPCPSGLVSSPGSVQCTDICPEGQQYNYAESQCADCPENTFATADMVLCEACPPNHVTMQGGSTSRSNCQPDCKPGEFWNPGVLNCSKCAEGLYQPDPYQSECIPCPVGKVTLTPGSIDPSNCTVTCSLGEEVVISTSGCRPCAIGFYRENEDDIYCSECPNGQTTAGTGSVSMISCYPICPPGTSRTVLNICEPCELGTYQDQNDQSECIECPEGRSTQTVGADDPELCLDLCPAGSEMINRDPLTCSLCPVDTFRQKDINKMCENCETGFMTLAPGSERPGDCLPNCMIGEEWNKTLNRCNPCPIGTYQGLPYQYTCDACPISWTTNDTGKTGLIDCLPDCVAGRKWDTTLFQCVDCGFGFYQPYAYQMSCERCPAGTTTFTSIATDIDQCSDPCPGGQQLPDNGITSVECVECPLNTYKDPNLDTKCQPCPPGFITEQIESQSLAACRANCLEGTRYESVVGQCVECSLGTYQDEKYQEECIPCRPSGFITLQIGADSLDLCVSPCDVGFEWIQDQCEPCDIGEYQDEQNQVDCKRCGQGETTSGPGSTSLQECFVPDVQCTGLQFKCDNGNCINVFQRCNNNDDCGDNSDERPSLCVQCNAGERRNGDICEDCPIGTFQNVPSSDFCRPCPQGQYTARSGAESIDECIECPAGSQFLQGGTACTQCPMNQYRELGLIRCMDCPQGFVTMSTGTALLAGCLPDCGLGTFYDGTQCVNCPFNQYQDERYMRQCKPCPDGWTTEQEGSKDLNDCIEPFSCDEDFVIYDPDATGNQECRPNCSPGFFYKNVLVADCDPCEKGKYQPEPSQPECLDCDEGLTTRGTGATTESFCIDTCPSGTQLNVTTTPETCTVCPKGFYRERGVNNMCQECPSKYTTSSDRGQSKDDCVPNCIEGSFWDGSQCELCAPGFYQDLRYQTTCKRCPDGTFVIAAGATSRFDCTDQCGEGTELKPDGSGSFTCEECLEGEVKVFPQTVCTLCEPSFTTVNDDNTECVPDCEIGYFWNENEAECQPCAKGFFQNYPHLTFCFQCPSGLTTIDIASISPFNCTDVCPSGTELTFDDTCVACRMNLYRTQFVQLQCTSCPDQFITLTDGANSEDECLPPCLRGSYWDSDETDCLLCPAGSYQDRDYQEQCRSCGDDQTTLDPTRTQVVTGATSQSQCYANCQEGEMLMKTTGKCVDCPTGTYQDQKYQDSCIPCPVGTTTTGTGSTAISDCQSPCGTGWVYDPDLQVCEPCWSYRCKNRDATNVCDVCNTPPGCESDPCPYNLQYDGVGCVEILCEEGTFFNCNDASCINCPINTYQNEKNRTFCKPCVPGTTSAEGSTLASECTDPCPSGFELPPGGSELSDCTRCKTGFYKSLGSTTVCQQCPLGFTTFNDASEDMLDCIPDCKAGSRINDDSDGCELCDIATYQPDDLQVLCLDCPAGNTTEQRGSTDPTECRDICNSGFELGADHLSCSACLKGSYRQQGVDIMCITCGVGYTTQTIASPGINSCVRNCKIGQEYNGATDQCVPCRIGTYQPLPYREVCLDCPSWKTTLEEGADSFDLCIDPCESGEFRDTSGNCQLCGFGTYRQKNIDDDCQQCQSGFTTQSRGATSRNECRPDCPAGSQWSQPEDQCVPCTPNTFNPIPYQYNCQPCPPEYPLNEDDFLSCRKECEPGEIWNREYMTCNWCPKGQYRPSTSAACIDCPGDRTTGAPGRKNITDCIPDCGLGQFWDGQDNCQPCPTGTFQSLPGPHDLVSCQDCTGNTYQNMMGQSSCNDCPTDQMVNTAKDNCIGMCGAGQFWNTAIDGCEDCPLDEYQISAGFHESCTDCGAGLHTMSTGSTDAADCVSNWCDPGFTHTGTECVPCGIGRYRAAGDDVCMNCPSGRTTLSNMAISATECIGCTAGEFLNRASGDCEPCPQHTYQDATLHSSETCIDCPNDYHTAMVGTTSVDDCKDNWCSAGEVFDTGTNMCTQCGANTYQDGDMCVDCPQGETSPPGSSSVDQCEEGASGWCPAGQEMVNGNCQPCGVGFYRPAGTSSKTCTACPAGKSTTGTGNTDISKCCDLCPACGFSYSVTFDRCLQCGPFGYKDPLVDPRCLKCPEGTNTSSSTIGACSLRSCTPAHICSSCTDLLILVDNSNSSNEHQIAHIRIDLKQLVSLFDYGTTGVRIGIVQFATSTADVITIANGVTQEAISTAIDGIMRSAESTTDHAGALDRARQILQAEGRADAELRVLLITDEVLGDANAARTQADAIKALPAEITVIGPEDSDVISLASDQDANHFMITNYENLPTPGNVVHAICHL